jgi:general secretion pathway protein L
MTVTSTLIAYWSRWIDDAAVGMSRALQRLRLARTVELREQADGTFLAVESRRSKATPPEGATLRLEQGALAGPGRQILVRSRVGVVLSPARFVFRTLELPRGADQFLEGVVRSQIDRLTPWSANEAAFGWSAPTDAGPDRIAVTVAATDRALIEPFVKAVMASRARSVQVSTRTEDASIVVPVWFQRTDQRADRRLRRYLAIGFGVASLGFVLSFGAWLVVGGYLENRERELQDQIAQRRAEFGQQTGSALEQAIQSLQARKRATPSAVLVIEDLSKALPDDAHLTELRMEDGNVQMVGLAHAAPALIRLIEQSGRFSRATFFAPTVRAPNGSETFHIEAHPEQQIAKGDEN